MNPVLTPTSVSREIGGRTLTIETGRMARQASGSATVTYGETVVFVAMTRGRTVDKDFLPMTVDYREWTSAAGKFPGGFFKREGRPSTKETLTARLIDRPIRPLIPSGFRDDIMVMARVFSADMENDPDLLGMIAGSAALALSGIPCAGCLGACRVGLEDGALAVNPPFEQAETSNLDLTVAGTRAGVAMVEAAACEVPEETLVDAIFFGQDVCLKIVEMIEELCAKAGVTLEPVADDAYGNELAGELYPEIEAACIDAVREKHFVPGKHPRTAALKEVREPLIEKYTEGIEDPDELRKKTIAVKEAFGRVEHKVVREGILEDRRADGRGPTDIRPISCEVGLLPRAHGSALFTRGETQALVMSTLGTVMDEQRVDGLMPEHRKRFMLHYNFPSFCVGETWPNRGPKRRDIGHGNLAERALKPVMPDYDRFPYTVRVASEIMESNGSSSMATVCGGTLACMDAGVRLKRPVAGIAMGLVKEGETVKVLSDILGLEDKHGDMDFKVAGSQKGVTALQMDIKVTGVSREVLTTALAQAREGRIHILRSMLKALPRPRKEVSAHAPKIVRVVIDPEQIGTLIGPGGKVIRKIQEETKTSIEIDDDTGGVMIAGYEGSKIDEAVDTVRALTRVIRVGEVFDGRVVSIRDFGAFIELVPGQEALLHVSDVADGYVEKVSDHVKMGDVIRVKVADIDPQKRMRLKRVKRRR